ncbi:glycosyltransferase [Gynuella sp.]|uniref:glycosyltransferase n=1 Tax=Gynuella sp. TaxID=2969146 RepID=UPI003D0A3A8D
MKVAIVKLGDMYQELGYSHYPDWLSPQKRGRKVLFIDTCFPVTSRDAASAAAVNEIKLFQALNYEVTFLALDDHLINTQSQRFFNQAGVRAEAFRDVNEAITWLKLHANQYSFFFVTRFHVLERTSQALRFWAPHARIILNLADLHYLRESRLMASSGQSHEQVQMIKQRELQQIRQADKVLSYSEHELDILIHQEQINPSSLSLCPWVKESETCNIQMDQRADIMFLGNFGHAPNKEGLSWFIERIWPKVRLKLPDVHLLICGAKSDSLNEQWAMIDGIRIMGWIEDLTPVYQSARVFVAPLCSGAGVKGKVIDALAHGLPTVMTTIAAEGIPVVNTQEAFITDNEHEWVEYLTDLYSNRLIWNKMSASSCQFVSAHYHWQRGLDQLKNILDDVSEKTVKEQ